MKKELTCIICPIGCALSAELSESGEISVLGNGCPRGKKYAEEELTAPKRTLTTVVRARTGEVVACKTDRPIPKEMLFSAMKIINSLKIDLPIRLGDVIINDIFGARLVATENKSSESEEDL